MLGRRTVLAGLVGLVSASCAEAAPNRDLVVYKNPACPCCGGWITAMAKAGFRPKVVNMEDISPLWRRRGVPDELSSCHVATIGAYLTIGHVPPADVERLLKEAPDAVGLSVPGMPLGSPGMEVPGGAREPYDTLLLLSGGKSRVYAKHA